MRSYPSALNPDVAVLLPEGRLDALGSPLLDRELALLHGQGRKQIVVNLGRTTYISSSGLRVILIHARQLRRAGGDLKLCCMTGKVERVIRIAGFDTVLDSFADEDSAVKAFQKVRMPELEHQPEGPSRD